MDDTDSLVIVMIVVSLIIGALWWGLVIFGIVKGAKYFMRQCEQQMMTLEALQRQWDQLSPQEQAAKQAQVAQGFQQLLISQHYT